MYCRQSHFVSYQIIQEYDYVFFLQDSPFFGHKSMNQVSMGEKFISLPEGRGKLINTTPFFMTQNSLKH